MPPASPTITAPGIESFGIENQPPPGSAFAPQLDALAAVEDAADERVLS